MKNIICQEPMLFSALTSLHVLASWGDLSQSEDGSEIDPLACARTGQQSAWSRGQESPGHHAADSSDLFLIQAMRASHTDHVAC